MPRKTDLISELYKQTLREITKDADAWRDFLRSAAYQYKYPFADQVLIYAQRPYATACAEFELWTERFGRRVKRGSTGIALIKENPRSGRVYLNYVFDISDTYHREREPFSIWQVKEGYEDDVIAALQNRFGELNDSDDLGNAIISVCDNLAGDHIHDYVSDLVDSAEGSFLEELDEDNLRVRLQSTVEASITFVVLTRLGFDADAIVGEEYFEWVHEFNTPATVGILGNATREIARLCLREIERTVKELDKVTAENRTVDAPLEIEYNEGENKENGGKNNDAHLQDGKWDDVAELEAPRTDESSHREVRSDAARLSEEAPQRDLHDASHGREAQQLSSRTERDGERADFAEYRTNGAEPWGGREDEAAESDDMGSDDEQFEENGGGGDPRYLDLPITGELPMPDEETIVIALRHGDFLRKSKESIVSFLRSDATDEQKTECVKSAYGIGLFGEFFRPGTREYIGYHAEPSGLLIYQDRFHKHTHEVKFSWDLIMRLIESLANDGKYLDEPKKEQLSFFDESPVDAVEEKPKKMRAISQEVIDEFLRLGGCTKHSAERIYAYYRRAGSVQESIRFLRNEYENDAVGLLIGGRKMAARWDENGICIAEGDNTEGAWKSVTLTWNEVNDRTRELIELGQYIPKHQADMADKIYEDDLAKDLAHLYYNGGTFESIPEEYKIGRSLRLFPDTKEYYKNILHDPAELERLCEEIKANYARLKEYPPRFHYVESEQEPFILILANAHRREPVTFKDADPNILPQQLYISEDRINRVIAGGSNVQDSKMRIYSFFLKNGKADERIKFLKGEYGIGGSYNGRVDTSFDGKGLVVGYSSLFSNVKLLLKWHEVEKRIDALIRAERYLNEKEAAYLDIYEKRQVARSIRGFYTDRGDDVIRPFVWKKGDYFETYEKELLPQLDDPLRVQEIYSTMRDIFETDMPSHRHYEFYKQNLQTMKEYAEGRYDLFPGSTYRARKKPIIQTPKIAEMKAGAEELRKGEFPETEYALHLGMTVHIGKYEREIISLSADTVELFDGTLIPLELPTDVFLKRLRENPLNDVLLKEPKAIPIPAITEQKKEEPNKTRSRKEKEPSVESLAASIAKENKEIEAVSKFLHSCKIDYYQYGYENGIFTVTDGEVTWTRSEFYEGLLNQIVSLDKNYKVVGNIEIPDDVLQAVIAYAKEAESVIYLQDVVEPNPLQESIDSELESAEPKMPTIQEPPKPQPKLGITRFHPEIEDEERIDHHIKAEDLPYRTPSDKYERNIRAIRLLHQLESEDRLATESEQRVLADYSGWGGLADAFDERNDHYEELHSLLTEEEYTAARESTLTAFYTPPVIIEAIYKVLDNMGFQGGNILEPSCGVGNFVGFLPDSMKDSKVYGVELDSLSGRMAQQLYQKQNIAVGGFEETVYPDSFFDVAIGNVPFGQFKVSDRKYDKYNFMIHDFFFAKALDKVRPGGVIAFVTSSGTMDKENPAIRKYIAERADFLGAVRLPDNAFKSAGTRVVSDIIFLQKRDRIVEATHDWIHLSKDENGISMNQYFVDHPDMILGEMVMRSGPYGPEPTCKAYEGAELEDLLKEVIPNIRAEITEQERETGEGEQEDLSIPADPTVKNFSYTLVKGKIYYRQNSRMNPVETSMTGENRIKGMIEIREIVRDLIDAQLAGYSDEDIHVLQERLNTRYDEFTAKYGLINSRANASVFREDDSYFLLCSLEILDDDTKELKAKADMFTKRTINPQVKIDHVDTASEALAVTIGERAMVDMDYMSGLTGKSEEELYADLKGVIFLNPYYGNRIGEQKYLMADEYLSGNVREKLEVARRTAELYPDDYAINVEALEGVQPTDLTASEIGVRLGSTWVPQEDIQDFVYELLGTSYRARREIGVRYIPQTAQWVITNKSHDANNVKVTNTYGTWRINAYEIIEDSLNLKDVRIFDYVFDEAGNKKAVLNKKETMIAQGKQEQIKTAFEEWLWKDPERRERLCKLYNEKFNAYRPREYDGSHIQFYGMSPEFTLRKHQQNAVARIMYGGNTLLAHCVGAGKSATRS